MNTRTAVSPSTQCGAAGSALTGIVNIMCGDSRADYRHNLRVVKSIVAECENEWSDEVFLSAAIVSLMPRLHARTYQTLCGTQ